MIQLHNLISTMSEHTQPNSRTDIESGPSMHSGNLGRVFALLHLCLAIDDDDDDPNSHLTLWKNDLLVLSQQYLESNRRTIKTTTSSTSVSVLLGLMGHHVVSITLQKQIDQDHSSITNSINTILEQGNAILSTSPSPDNHGLQEGTSGYIWGLLYLRRTVPETRSLLSLELLEKLSLFLLRCGMHYAAATQTTTTSESKTNLNANDYIIRLPLMYKHNGVKVLGAKNGVIGIVYVLVLIIEEFQTFASSCSTMPHQNTISTLKTSVKLTIDYLLHMKTTSGNMKSRPEDNENEQIGWKDGVIGMGMLLLKCDQIFIESSLSSPSKFLTEADLIATFILSHIENVDNAEIGLEEGISGIGYFFLTLFNITGEKKYRDIVENLVEKVKQNKTKENYSLFNGTPGVICFIADVVLASNNVQGFPCFQLPVHRDLYLQVK